MMKKIKCGIVKNVFYTALAALLMFPFTSLKAQLKAGTDGIYIKSGTSFVSDGLSMVPSSDFSLTGLSLLKKPLAVSWPQQNGIVRLYQFSRPVSFAGTLGMYYDDHELNGNKAGGLSITYSNIPSIDHKEFSFIPEAKVNEAERLVSHPYVSIAALSDLTAVTAAAAGQYKLLANNMITPNGDGINDTWIVNNLNQFPNNELKIFDRSGRVVYSAHDYDNSWDGTHNGRQLAEDSYYFVLYFNSGRDKISGYISLVKKE